MKKGLIFTVLLMSVITFGFSQTNSWTVTNSSTWIEAVNGVRSGGNDKTYTITVNGTVSVPGSTESTFGAVTGITVNMEGSGTLSPSNNGAVLWIGASQTIIVRDVTLRGRTGNGSYSVVAVMNESTFIMGGNASITGNTRSGYGGGVYVAGGRFTMQDNASISGNNATSGGGVYVNNGFFTIQGGTISNNSSSSTISNNPYDLNTYPACGGGVYVGQNATFTMRGGTISGNTNATNSDDGSFGGGVYVGENATFNLIDGTISNNTTTFTGSAQRVARGGGVHSLGTFTMYGGTISNNTASTSSSSSYPVSQGGGVSVSSGTFTMLGGTISGNTAAGAGTSNGGGVFVTRPVTFTMHNGRITGNISSGISRAEGGGVYVSSYDSYNIGSFDIQGGIISGNTANNNGGGVYVRGGTFTMQNNATSISGNTAADSGGGVYVGGGTFTMQDSASISGNTATYYGGGVYNGGTFNKTGGTIYGEDADTNQRNTVVSRIGNAVYNSANSGWRNVTAGITMNSDSYGFWLNDGEVVTFPSGFAGRWGRNNFNNTLTLSSTLIKSSSSDRFWILQRVSGNSYTFKRADATNTITLNISQNGNNLVISGDSGSGQDNWNGTWFRIIPR